MGEKIVPQHGYDSWRPGFGTRFDRFTPNEVDKERAKAEAIGDLHEYDSNYKTSFCVRCNEEREVLAGSRKQKTDGSGEKEFICADCACKESGTISSIRPELKAEYSDKNSIPFNLLRIDSGSNVLWICGKHGHSWRDTPERRAKGAECPECKRMRVESNKKKHTALKEQQKKARNTESLLKIVKQVESINWTLEEEEWMGSNHYYNLICPNGHKVLKQPAAIKSNLACRKCR